MYYPFTLNQLNYSYDSLEPYISRTTIKNHYELHLGGYITKLNNILKNFPMYHMYSLVELLENSYLLPLNIRSEVINNGYGIYLHMLYFNNLKKEVLITQEMMYQIIKDFNSFEEFEYSFKTVCNNFFGSGWVILCLDECNVLRIIEVYNNDLNSYIHYKILLVIDLFEHSYYLDYFNRRNLYIDNFFKMINWNNITL